MKNLVDAGADLIALQRHRRWKSSTITERYITVSFTNKVNIADKIFGGGTGKEKSASSISIIAEEQLQ